jgi:hypothetical protein
MPAARDGLAKIRGNIGRGAALVLGQTGDRKDECWTTHARPQRLRVSEKYHVTQEISKNSWEDYDDQAGKGPASGFIELAIPYDGYGFFPQQARADVAERLAAGRPGNMAVLGHLVLEDHEGKTNGLPEPRESVPIEIPVASPRADGADPGQDGLGHLSADRWTCVIKHEYKPERPDPPPAKLKIDLYDPDSLDLPDLDLETEEGRATMGRLTELITERIRRQMSFRNPIILRIVACLTVPKRDGRELEPEVARMAIGWPVITSLRAVSLRVGADLGRADRPDAEISYSPRPVRYNPVTKRIEWEHVRMIVKPGSHDDVSDFETPPMLLTIQQPGDLYRQDILTAHAEVRIPRYLMSGLNARIKEDDEPERSVESKPRPELSLITRVEIAATLMLDDAFTKRLFSPYRHLFFDGIKLNEMRITDIRTGLRDLGFEEFGYWRVGQHDRGRRDGQGTVSWLLAAYRSEGPHRMVLWISAEGRSFETKLKQSPPGGGREVKSTKDSGDLSIFIWGTMPGDHHKLSRQMNALQTMLRERYDRVRHHS